MYDIQEVAADALLTVRRTLEQNLYRTAGDDEYVERLAREILKDLGFPGFVGELS